jgi:hypothetical protein
MEAVCISETLFHFNVTTRRYIAEDSKTSTGVRFVEKVMIINIRDFQPILVTLCRIIGLYTIGPCEVVNIITTFKNTFCLYDYKTCICSE